MDVYALFEENPLITTEEYIRRIQAYNLPKPLEESLIDLGIAVREWADSQGSEALKDTRSITITVAIDALIIIVVTLFVAYWCLPQVQDAYQNLSYDFDAYIGKEGYVIAKYIYQQVIEALNSGGGSEAAIAEAVSNINDNKKHHILQDKHNWNKLVPNPNDPNNWNQIATLISLALSEGTEEPYGSAFKTVLEYGVQIIEVTYQYVDGILRISDAWVK